jgi:transglutaminase-like putative cysteine protease
MAIAAIFPVYQGTSWFWPVLGAVLAVTVAGLLTRTLRVPGLLQPVVAVLLLAGYLVVVFAHGTLQHGLPTADTVDRLRDLLQAGQSDLDKYGPPVPTNKGLVLLTAAGVGAVALVVDLFAVVLDRVALAGLPLLALFAVPSAVLPGGLGGTAFAVGAVGWLVLLLEEGGERVGRWGAPLRATAPGARAGGDDSSLGRVGRRIGAAALGIAVVVPALLPGLDHRLIGGSGDGPGAGSDGPSSATTYNPLTTLQAQLTLPRPKQLFVYSTDDPEPDYVRMTSLDTYNGYGWASSKLEADRQDARVQKGIDRPTGEDSSAPHRTFEMRMAMDGDSLQVHWLPVPYGPVKVDVDGTWLWDSTSQTVFSASRTTKGLKPYTVRAARVLPTPEGLQAASNTPVDPEIDARYGGRLKVSSAVQALADRVTRRAVLPYDKAVAIQRWFTNPANGFVYDVDPSRPSVGQDPLEAFLQGKHGFCEQFATAMAVMLRLEGLPSRVAVGFTPGQAVPGHAGTFSVTTSDAHAWPEAWFPGYGWIRFEPTPAATGASTPDYAAPAQPTGPTDQPTTAPSPRASSGPGPGAFHDADTLLGPGGTDRSTSSTSGHGLRWLLGAAVVLVLLSPSAATQLRRRWRARRIDPLVAWEQLHDDVADVGGPWRETDSPGATARRLDGLLDASGRAALARLATAAELVRYAPPGRASSTGLVEDGTAVRRALRASAPRAVRWRALVLPPSTLRWGMHQATERVADVLDLTDRVLAAVFRPARRVLRLRA